MSLEVTLTCTCTDGWTVEGKAQEVVEKLLAERLGLTVERVHHLLDLHDQCNWDALDDIDKGATVPDDGPCLTVLKMAERSGIPLEWLVTFSDAWEKASDEVAAQNLYLRTKYHIPRRKV